MLNNWHTDVVQYDVVLVNGTQTVANACKNQELFWAMRGGGGVFAIASKTYIKAHPAFQAVNVVVGQVTASSETAYKTMISTFVEHDQAYGSNFSSGIWEASYPSITLSFQKGFQTHETVVLANQSLQVFDFLKSIDGVTSTLAGYKFATWDAAYDAILEPMMDTASPVGVNVLDVSRIVPNTKRETTKGRTQLADFVLSLNATQPFIFQRGTLNCPFLCGGLNSFLTKISCRGWCHEQRGNG